ncbi:acyltransferase family protein [Ekhidna sp. To15]|uniref:acyltransferase family protein n=1 Tax=Ekhidna sp. To15 TaxID=3395267 RepID=UPI003F524D59
MNANKRYYYIDWLRVLAFGLLFLFHSWRPFDHMPWHVKNDEQSVIFDLLTFFAHGWRMALIFLVSGAGTYLAMRSRKEAFLKDRIKRLLVPFFFGILLIIPPQRFYEWIMFRGFQGDFLTFITEYPTYQLDNDMGVSVLLWFGHLGTHLWYLPYLFVMILFTLPLLKRIKNHRFGFTFLKRLMEMRFGILLLALPVFMSRLILKPIFSEYTDWADFFIYLWPFLYGFIFMVDHKFIQILKKKMLLLLNCGILSSTLFIYIVSLGEDMIMAYVNPSFSLLHAGISLVSAVIAVSWILFFVGLFAKTMNFNHQLLIPANISILPIYVMHQTLIIIFGYYIVQFELNLFFKFILIAFTAIPMSVVIYKVVKTNNITRFLFGLKPIGRV